MTKNTQHILITTSCICDFKVDGTMDLSELVKPFMLVSTFQKVGSTNCGTIRRTYYLSKKNQMARAYGFEPEPLDSRAVTLTT